MVWANNDHQDCKYTVEDIDKIISFKSWSDKEKVDTLLHIDCAMYTNLGIRFHHKRKKRSKTKITSHIQNN